MTFSIRISRLPIQSSQISWINTSLSCRSFHTTALACIRKKPDFVVKRSPEEKLKRDELRAAYAKYAPSEEQATLIRETILVRTYLEKIQNELPVLLEHMPNEPYTTPPPSHYLRFRYMDDLRNPDVPEASNVDLSIHVPQLVEVEKLTPDQTHLLLLLCGENYDPLTKKINLSCLRFTYRAQNRKWLVDLVLRLLDHVKSAEDYFKDLPLNSDHVRERMRYLERVERCKFPKSWLPSNKSKSKVKPSASVESRPESISNSESPQSLKLTT